MASDRRVVQSLDRALSILEVLRLSAADLPLSEVAARAGLPKSTTHRLLSTLELRGMVDREPMGGTYRLSSRTITPAGAGPEVRAVLLDLAERRGETANLGALIGSEVLYVDRGDSPQALRWQLGVGSRVPVHCSGMGKAMLAYLPPDEVRRRLRARLRRHTANTIVERSTLIAELEDVRARGFAMDNEEFMEGVRCVAVPVETSPGEVAHAVSLAGPAFRLTTELAVESVPALREAAVRIGALLGGRPVSRDQAPG
jgi:DNA-binding IclR family transcriptional regulator